MKDRDHFAPQVPIHPTHHMRLANSIHGISLTGKSIELLDSIINCAIWDVYGAGDRSGQENSTHRDKLNLTLVMDDRPREVSPPSFGELWACLDNPTARRKIQNAFTVTKKDCRPTSIVLRTGLRVFSLFWVDCFVHHSASSHCYVRRHLQQIEKTKFHLYK
jgi:hypothetical protein